VIIHQHLAVLLNWLRLSYVSRQFSKISFDHVCLGSEGNELLVGHSAFRRAIFLSQSNNRSKNYTANSRNNSFHLISSQSEFEFDGSNTNARNVTWRNRSAIDYF